MFVCIIFHILDACKLELIKVEGKNIKVYGGLSAFTVKNTLDNSCMITREGREPFWLLPDGITSCGNVKFSVFFNEKTQHFEIQEPGIYYLRKCNND